MYLKSILYEFERKYGFFPSAADILKDTGTIRNSSMEAAPAYEKEHDPNCRPDFLDASHDCLHRK